MQGGGQPQGGQPPQEGAPSGPVSSPMSAPQPNEGEKQHAMAQVQMAIELLEQTLAKFGSDSDEGQAVLDVLKKLGSKFGDKKDKARGLIPSEIMNLVASLPKEVGGQPQEQQEQQAGAEAAPGGGMPQQPMMQ